jgi:asparagine synthase (glutamine-hydrolysing)
MTDVLAHRGPDGDGTYVDGAVGLGHRRLAIIDLAAGRQPMASTGGTTWISFNGEIYNFRELRSQLQELGYRFQTSSDTEVILAAYEAWGVECLSRLRGMFAFGIWDLRRRRLFLARDRVGIKPLVYAWDGQRLLFASELKAILQVPGVPRELDWDALRDYFIFHYIPSPRTIFKHIRKLPPACCLLLDLDRGQPEVRRYWDLRFVPQANGSEAKWLEGLRWHLEDAVRSHLVSDVPIGAFLSGGMDSSTVVALMARAAGGPVRTFSIGFDETDFDELAFARAVAQRYGTRHHEFVVKPDALEALPRLAWQFDEPFADASAVPTYYVAKITRDHVTVALSGDGGDENFAGYRRYAEAVRVQRQAEILHVVKPLLRLAAACLPEAVPGRGHLALLGMPPLHRYFRMMTYQHDQSLAALLRPEAGGEVAPRTDPEYFYRLAAEGGAPDHLSTLQYLDVRHYLPEDILTKVDRTSMLVALEARVPLLDHVLMEYVATIPSQLKLRNGSGKAILKQGMSKDLPAEILHRRKMGFGVPLAAWFRKELKDFAIELLTDRRTRERGIIRPEAATELLETHLGGRRDRSAQLWALICFELWCREWGDRR